MVIGNKSAEAATDRMLRADEAAPFHGHDDVAALSEHIRRAYARGVTVLLAYSAGHLRGLDSLVPGSIILDYDGKLWLKNDIRSWVTEGRTLFGHAGRPVLPVLVVVDKLRESA